MMGALNYRIEYEYDTHVSHLCSKEVSSSCDQTWMEAKVSKVQLDFGILL